MQFRYRSSSSANTGAEPQTKAMVRSRISQDMA